MKMKFSPTNYAPLQPMFLEVCRPDGDRLTYHSLNWWGDTARQALEILREYSVIETAHSVQGGSYETFTATHHGWMVKLTQEQDRYACDRIFAGFSYHRLTLKQSAG